MAPPRPVSPAETSPPFGSINDVDGVRVGHHQRRGRGWMTGTSVLLVPGGATPGVSVRGGGPGTRETDALHPENLVQRIHAICLTGSSAFGLAAADGVMSWLEERGLGFPIGNGPDRQGVVPVVPTAVVFDLGRGGRFDHRADADFGRRAVASARTGQRSWGAVGAGTGARSAGLQGGVGTASTRLSIPGPELDGATIEITVGAVAVVNSNGTAIDPATGLPWVVDGSMFRSPNQRDRRRVARALTGQSASLNTTIGVVATSAALTKSEATKLAGVAHDGLARAIRPAHSMFDGDTVFALATGAHDIGDRPAAMGSSPTRQATLNAILSAGADTFASACVHAVVAASTIGDAPAYRDLCPSAFARPADR